MNKQLMISIIDAAKKQLDVGNSELSLKLGHHRNYISRVLHQEKPTPEQITKVVDKVNAMIGEQKELLPEFKHTPIADAVMVSKDEYDKLKESSANLFNELSIRDFQINKFKKELNHKNQVLDKRNAVLENHIDRVNELELQLKTTQQKFVDVVDQKDKEIKKLQNDRNHATNQYQGKRAQVVRLNEKLNKQVVIYLIIIVIISLVGIMGFAS